MKRTTLLSVLFLLAINVNAQNGNYVLSYRQAKNNYEEKNYGKALKNAEDAIVYRKQQINYELSVIQNSLASKEVKKAGDRIDNVLLVIEDRGEKECSYIINSYLNKKGEAFFDNSISKLVSFIQTQERYPEAEKLLGDIYKLEGEYEFAEEYYLKALDKADILDIPDEKYEILYQLADLSRLQNDFEKMEVRLLNIVGQRDNERNILISSSIKNTVKKNSKDSIDKIFELYRAYDYYALNAYCQLADYYMSIKEYSKAFDYSALAVITGYTKIYTVIEKRDLFFEFTGLADFLDTLEYHGDILDWGRKNNVWRSFNLFCQVSSYLGYDTFSTEFLRILAFHSPEKFWQQDAVLKLDVLDGIKNPD